MDPITIAMLGMSGLQMIHGIDKENRDRQLAAATQRYSPWTGLKANPIEAANPVGDLAQGGAGALAYEQNKESAALHKKLVEAQIGALNRGQYPWGVLRGNGSTDLYGNGAFSNMG